MLLNEIVETIKYHIIKKKIIRIERKDMFDAEPINGLPIMLSNRFLLMTVVNDFHDEGYAILNIANITDAYSNEYDTFYEKICISEGLLDIPRPKFLSSIHSYKQIFKCLQVYEGLVSIQCEKQIKRCAFYLGIVKAVKDENVEFLDIGMDGKWDNETHIIQYDEITQINFGDNYSKMYYKYCDKIW